MNNFKAIFATTILLCSLNYLGRSQETPKTNHKVDKIPIDTAQLIINALTEDEMYTYNNIWYIYNNTTSAKHRGFAFFRDHAKKIAHINNEINEEYSKSKVLSIIIAEAITPYTKSKNGKADWNIIVKKLQPFGALGATALEGEHIKIIIDDEIKPLLEKRATWSTISAKIKSLNLAQREEFVYGSVNIFYLNTVSNGIAKDISLLIKALNYYINKYPIQLTAETLNSWAWLGFEKFTKKTDLQAATNWAKLGVEKGPEFPNIHDTYANLLYRIGNTAEALIWQAKAVQLAPDDPEIKANYEKMKAGQ